MTALKSSRARNARIAAQASRQGRHAVKGGTAVKNGSATRNGGAAGNGQARTAAARNGAVPRPARGAQTPVIQDDLPRAGPLSGCSSPPSCWRWPGLACRFT